MVRRERHPSDWYLTVALINFLDRPPSRLEMLHLSQKELVANYVQGDKELETFISRTHWG